jgi:hypothetical protein
MVKIHLFQSHECCPVSESTESCCQTSADTEEERPLSCQEKCSHEEEEVPLCCNEKSSHKDVLPVTATQDKTCCCAFEFLYFKIASSYVASQYDKISQPNTYCNIVLFDLPQEESKLPSNETAKDKVLPEKIPPLIPGGERFIIYAHQLLFYA